MRRSISLKIVKCDCRGGEKLIEGLFKSARLLQIIRTIGVNCESCGKIPASMDNSIEIPIAKELSLFDNLN